MNFFLTPFFWLFNSINQNSLLFYKKYYHFTQNLFNTRKIAKITEKELNHNQNEIGMPKR